MPLDDHGRQDPFYSTSVSFLVEDEFFKLCPLKFVTESELFAKYYFPNDFAPNMHRHHQLGDDDHPIVLDGVQKDDFVPFLRVMFPTEYGSEGAHALTTDEWISVLKLATLWGFDRIRANAIKYISGTITDPMMRITLADQYGIIDWLLPALDALHASGTPLSPSELANMDLDYALKLVNTRRDFFTDHCACNWDFRSYVPPIYSPSFESNDENNPPRSSRSFNDGSYTYRDEYGFVDKLESIWSHLRHGRTTLRRRKTR